MASICSSCLRQHFKSLRTPVQYFFFTTSLPIRSGHSKWATIKHDKARNDAAKSRQRTVLLNDISKAIELFGPDQTSNPRLAQAIAKAKRASCPKDSIDGALARGQGLSLSGAKLEAFTEEAMLPSHSVGMLIECLTDNKNRTRLEVRNLLKDNEANLASTAYLFSKRGHLKFGAGNGKINEGILLECAIDAGALDVASRDDGGFEILTEVQDINKVCSKIKDELGIEADDVDVLWVSNSASELPLKDVEKDQVEHVQDLTGKLRDISSVRGVYLTAL